MRLAMYRIVVLSAGLLFCSILRAEGRKVLYTNHWALEIVGNEQEADDIALKHGFVNKGQVLYWFHFASALICSHDLRLLLLLFQIAGLVGYYHFWRPSQVDLSPNEERNVKDELLAESQVSSYTYMHDSKTFGFPTSQFPLAGGVDRTTSTTGNHIRCIRKTQRSVFQEAVAFGIPRSRFMTL